jgi:4-hydroxy-2-oxoheptanedioate aldolase
MEISVLATFAGVMLMQVLPAGAQAKENPILALLSSGKAAFGSFSDKTRQSASTLSADDRVDFVFYDMETGPFDVDGMRDFMTALGGRSLAARLPPIRDGREVARERVRLLLDAGVDLVVYPHVGSREDAELAVRATGERALNLLIIEDRAGVANAREIVSTPGVDIVFPGPGDLRRAYQGDLAAVEKAIQSVLSACRSSRVVCGITAGPEDIAKRLEEGFRVFIVKNPDALPIGRRASSR